MNIPLGKPYIGEEEIALVREVLESGWLAHGPKNKEFEKNFAKYIKVKHAISLNSCTSALQLAILANNLKGEIIVPGFTFIASANAVVTSGCKPVFADVDFSTRNLDPTDFEKRITDKTVAVMPVHYGGMACQMDEIMEIAEKHNLLVIEDSAETIGGEFKGKKTGSFGLGCFSFFPIKNLTTGEGGMFTTNDSELADKVRTLRGHGISSSTWGRKTEKIPWIRDAVLPGFNFRMCDVLAAIGLVQLRKLDRMNDLRRSHAKYLNKGLSGIEGIETPIEMDNTKHVYQMYTITLDGIDRGDFISFLKDRGIGASVHFDPPAHLNSYYMKAYGYKRGDLPVTEKLADSIVTLPMFPGLVKEQLDEIISVVSQFRGGKE